MHPLLILSLVLLGAYLLLGVELLVHLDATPKIIELPAREGDDLPRVSIIAAARNEERKIEEGLQSLLALDYPALEIVLVNDRSTDRTGAIAHALAEHDARLTVVDIETLPSGWLGKNHALQQGAANASGEFLLFTDADVILERSILRRVVPWINQERIDHLTASPRLIRTSLPLSIFIASFMFFFGMFTRPWRASRPGSREHIGIGAFNLVRAEAYRAVGGHTRIPMRPDDDLKLGLILKRSGARQQFVAGKGAIEVEWYGTLREAIDGLMKNAYSGVEYSPVLLVGALLMGTLFCVWPFIAPFVTTGMVRLVSVATALLILALVAWSSHRSGFRPVWALGFPLGAVTFLWVVLRAAWITHRNGGIRWRDTFYPLAELRANRVERVRGKR